MEAVSNAVCFEALQRLTFAPKATRVLTDSKSPFYKEEEEEIEGNKHTNMDTYILPSNEVTVSSPWSVGGAAIIYLSNGVYNNPEVSGVGVTARISCSTSINTLYNYGSNSVVAVPGTHSWKPTLTSYGPKRLSIVDL